MGCPPGRNEVCGSARRGSHAHQLTPGGMRSVAPPCGRCGSRPPSWPASRCPSTRPLARRSACPSRPRGRSAAVPGRPANVAAGSRLTRDQRSSAGPRLVGQLRRHAARRAPGRGRATSSGAPLETTVRYWPLSGSWPVSRPRSKTQCAGLPSKCGQRRAEQLAVEEQVDADDRRVLEPRRRLAEKRARSPPAEARRRSRRPRRARRRRAPPRPPPGAATRARVRTSRPRLVQRAPRRVAVHRPERRDREARVAAPRARRGAPSAR